MKRPWRGAVILCVGMLLALPVLAAGFPWKVGDMPPAVAGVHLGDDRRQLEKVLGSASEIEDLAPDSFALLYKERGLGALYTTHDGVTVLYLMSPDAGDIDGIRVGDSRDTVLQKWGAPSSVNGPEALYQAGAWVVALQLGDGQTVVRLSMARAAGAGQ